MKMDFLTELKLAGLPLPICKDLPPGKEHRFAAEIGRDWRFDYSWPGRKIALEVEGGVYIDGRHVRGSGFIEDMRKYDCAELMGWTVLRVMPSEFSSGYAFRLVSAALTGTQPTADMFPVMQKRKKKKILVAR